MNRLFPSRGQSGSSLGCRPAHASKLRGRGFPSKERASFSEELLAANAGATARLRAGGTEEESPLERGRRAAWSLITATDGVFGVRAEANNNGKMGKHVRTVSSVVKEACPVQTLDTKLH